MTGPASTRVRLPAARCQASAGPGVPVSRIAGASGNILADAQEAGRLTRGRAMTDCVGSERVFTLLVPQIRFRARRPAEASLGAELQPQATPASS